MKIAILGGAFDPPHIGHYLVGRQVLEQMKMDQVWFMVCYQYFPEFPVKNARISSYNNRFTMVKHISSPPLLVSDFESKYNKPSKTIDTLSLLNKRYPEHSFHWIIGSDQLNTFHLWNKWKLIIAKYNLIVFPRDTDFLSLENRVKKSFKTETIPHNITVLKSNELVVSNISSSLIRKRVRLGLPIGAMVDQKVEKYIKKHNIYVDIKNESVR